MHNGQFSPRHPPHMQQHQNGALITGSASHLQQMSFNHIHQQQHRQHANGHLQQQQPQPMLDFNNNSAVHMYNQPSLLIAPPINPGPDTHFQPLQTPSEVRPADSSEATTPTSDSCGESTMSSQSDTAGSQSQTFYHQNGIIATQLGNECQKGPLTNNNQYVSLFIV